MILDTQIPLLETQDTATQVQEPAKLGTVQSADTSVPSNDSEKLLTADSGICLSEETSISSSITPNTENAVDNCVEMEESIPDAPVNQVNCLYGNFYRLLVYPIHYLLLGSIRVAFRRSER